MSEDLNQIYCGRSLDMNANQFFTHSSIIPYRVYVFKSFWFDTIADFRYQKKRKLEDQIYSKENENYLMIII